MVKMVDWSRQAVILIVAALFAVYWTGKQGLWDALRGHSPWEKEWQDAKMALVRRLSNKYEVVDGSNQRFEKRIVILTASKRDSNSTTAPVVVAEMYSARRNPMQMHNKRKQEKMRERSVGKGGRGEKGPGSNRRSRGRGGRGGRYDMPMREPVARLKIYDPSLDYLKEIFGKNARRGPDSLIDTNDQRSSSGSDTAEQSRKKEREEGVPPGVELPDEQDESFDRYEDDVQEHEEF
uniref:Uncharacterized protein n=1 Tax=Hanusia phi TaxID=3032 RepID=A0A7S0NB77_9CRYP